MTTTEKLAAAIEAIQAVEPDIYIEVGRDKLLVGFWFETATGRQIVVRSRHRKDETFFDVYKTACELRATKIAECEIEAQVRAEVAERMKAAA